VSPVVGEASTSSDGAGCLYFLTLPSGKLAFLTRGGETRTSSDGARYLYSLSLTLPGGRLAFLTLPSGRQAFLTLPHSGQAFLTRVS